MSLANLPPEVLSLILHHVDSPRNLYHFISASPASFRVFSQSRKRILSSVIKNALPGQSVQHALAVLQAPSVSRSQVHPFLDKYFGSTSSFDFPTNEAGLLQLYHLYNRISYLLDGFLKSVQELGFDESVLRPSLTERTRLQRAFLRFELYSRVFPRRWIDPYPSAEEASRREYQHPASQQFSLFLANLTPWEAEEMACIQLYFSCLIDKFIDERGDQPAQEKDNQKVRLVNFGLLDLTSLVLFSSDGRYRSPDYVSYMTSLGLDFMYNLVKYKSKRAELIRTNHPMDREFLPEALKHSPRVMPGGEYDVSSANDTADDDDPSHSNLGYRQFRKTGQTGKVHLGIHLTGSSYSSLRQLGYVFWDSGRIQTPEVLEKLSAAERMSWDEIRLRFDRRKRETAESLLKGTKLPIAEMERIEQEFGSAFLQDDE
ncbi:hypothetical protein NM208_g3654 [Fusarium decemcellulare]|uniref:Uncharacterized protein n=1 Tax=Fusarium decemcellulare TaxID=57161 RepID=A0ACC1SNI5_9HYPO|nr:hypothetical protein NM208_g3654 [Fusarium decemcellulare]